MSIIVEVLPQNIDPIVEVKITDLIGIMPDKLPWDINVWIGGKIAKYGVTTENLIFTTDSKEETNTEKRMYFNGLSEKVGTQGTLSSSWMLRDIGMMRLYNDGRLIIDKKTMCYKELPNPVASLPIFSITELVSKLERTVKWKENIWLTGGIVKNGWSANDIDFIVFDEIPNNSLVEIKLYFTKLFGWKVDIGKKVMPDREPVYLYKLYDNGNLCLS